MAESGLFQEAVDALNNGDKAHARELLTELIKQDQNNAEYWVWLSATMETAKERLYCLQTAIKLDPENESAKRGLILLGGMAADETVKPFSMNRTRAWEEKLLLAHEKPKLKGWAAIKASPVTRLVIIILLVGGIASGIAFGYVIPAMEARSGFQTFTPGPSPTYTLTVTAIGGRPRPQTDGTPAGPLAELLEVPYTPTALYVETERSPTTSDFVLQFSKAFSEQNYDEAIANLEEIIRLEPDFVFAYYYLGESYRFKGNPSFATQFYNAALSKDSNFGPGYVGLARTQLMNNPNANVLPLLNDAIRVDPNFGEAFLERGKIKIRDNDITGAINDLGEANRLLPNSPLVFYHLAEVRLKEGEYGLALNSAQRSNELDITYLPTYLMLGQINAQLGNDEDSVYYLSVYTAYVQNDLGTIFLLGEEQYKAGYYAESIQYMDRITLADRDRREPYLYRFLSNVELGNLSAADDQIDRVLAYYPNSFDLDIAIIRLHLNQKRNGSALQYVEKTLALAETDEQKALAYYWAAVTHEVREEFDDAGDNWELLLDLPASAMTEEMRKVAQEHLLDIRTPVPTSSPTRTPTPTKTSTPTPTRTPTPSQ